MILAQALPHEVDGCDAVCDQALLGRTAARPRIAAIGNRQQARAVAAPRGIGGKTLHMGARRGAVSVEGDQRRRIRALRRFPIGEQALPVRRFQRQALNPVVGLVPAGLAGFHGPDRKDHLALGRIEVTRKGQVARRQNGKNDAYGLKRHPVTILP